MLLLGFVLAGLATARKRRTAMGGMVAAMLLGALAGLLFVREDLLVRVLPFSGAVFYSNLFPCAAVFLIPNAVKLARSRAQRVRIVVLCVVLFALSVRDWRRMVLPEAECAETRIDKNGVCRQTSADTCSAACGVTLLRHYGIITTEAEVARLALTRRDLGTRAAGLYRAISLLAARRPELTVKLDRSSLEQLLARNKPAIITVGLPKKRLNAAQQDLAARYNWTPGVWHDVVLFHMSKAEPGKADIGEPDFGLEQWPIEQLRTLYQCTALYIE